MTWTYTRKHETWRVCFEAVMPKVTVSGESSYSSEERFLGASQHGEGQALALRGVGSEMTGRGNYPLCRDRPSPCVMREGS